MGRTGWMWVVVMMDLEEMEDGVCGGGIKGNHADQSRLFGSDTKLMQALRLGLVGKCRRAGKSP